jgi:hypothetical protein
MSWGKNPDYCQIQNFFLRLKGLTLAKIIQSHQKTNWNYNSSVQNYILSFNPIVEKMAIESMKN